MTVVRYRRNKRGKIEAWHFMDMSQVPLGPEWSSDIKSVPPYIEKPAPAKPQTPAAAPAEQHEPEIAPDPMPEPPKAAPKPRGRPRKASAAA